MHTGCEPKARHSLIEKGYNTMKRLIFCMVFLGVALGLTTAQAAITWNGDFTTFRYDVNKNGGMFAYPPSYFSSNQDTEFFYNDPSQGAYDPYNSVASGDLVEFGASIPGEIRMTAMAKGPAGGTSPSDGLEVQAFTKVALTELTSHCLDVTQKAVTWVNRQFSVDSAEEYVIGASLNGLVNFNAFGTPPYAATYSLSGEVVLTEIVGTWPNETFTQVAVLALSESTREASEQITLVNQNGGEPVRYELKAQIILQSRLVNFALPTLEPLGTFPQAIYKLGDESAPFVLRARVYGDHDNDGVPDAQDNCPGTYNPDQADFDGDGLGDACDPDDDNDGVPDTEDNCPNTYNPNQANFDGDGLGDACDPDDDNDGVPDTEDEFPLDPNEWVDTDHDGIGNNADLDDDNDGMPDVWEIANGLNPLVNDSALDADGDGASNLNEYLAGTDPQDPDSFPKKGKAMPWIMLLLD